MIPALVLAAGLGTRARPLTLLRAKAALPVSGQPLIVRILRWLAAYGITDIVLNLHHRPETIAGLIGDGSGLGVGVHYSWEQPLVLGSAGGPRRALDIIGSSPFFIINGDTLTDVDPRAVLERHRESGARVTMAFVPNAAPLHYGGAAVDREGFVSGFVRRGAAAAGSYHFIGVQVAAADVFEPLVDGSPANSVGGCYDALIRDDRRAIAAHISTASFWDIGTPADYLATSLAFAARERTPPHGRNVTIDASAAIVDSVLWDDVSIGARSVLSRCIVTDGVSVGNDCRHEGMIIMAAAGGRTSAVPLET